MVQAEPDELTSAGQFILTVIRTVFEEKLEWPTVQYVRRELLKSYEGDFLTQLELLVPKLVMVYGMSGATPQADNSLHLTYLGYKLAGGSERLQKAVDLLHWLMDRERSFEPSSPTKAETLTITADEADAVLGWSREDSVCTFDLLQEVWGWNNGSGSGNGPDGKRTWTAQISEDIRAFRHIETVDDLIAHQSSQREKAASSSPFGPPLWPASRASDASSSSGDGVASYASLEESPVPLRLEERLDGSINTRALGDQPAEADLLGFSVYARSLADFVGHKNTERPLTIAIDAPWGMGKTSLMKQIEHELRGRNEHGKTEPLFRTVWFNAWKVDREDESWAALPLEILSEVKRHLTWWQRIAFAWRLNSKVPWWTIASVIVFGLLLIALRQFGHLSHPIVLLSGLIAEVGGTAGLAALAYHATANPFASSLVGYLKSRSLGKRLETKKRFEMEFERAVDIVTEHGKWPLIVFIDDLDRCAPSKVAEILETLNLVLAAKHCAFILGIDSATIASDINASYKDLPMAREAVGAGSSFGDRFLEKIVQITFRIPQSTDHALRTFVGSTLQILKGATLSADNQISDQRVLEQRIVAGERLGQSIGETVAALRSEVPEALQGVVDRAAKEVQKRDFEDSPTIQQAIDQATLYLGRNPRRIKRFLNTFRLQALIVQRQGLMESGGLDPSLLAKSVVIAMRWPLLLEMTMEDQDAPEAIVELRELESALREDVDPSDVAIAARQANRDRRDDLLKDPRLQALAREGALGSLLSSIDVEQRSALRSYLQIAKSAVPGSSSAQDLRADPEI